MKLRISSDQHLEVLCDRLHKIPRILDKIILPPLDTDKDSILMMAGDLGSMYYPKCAITALEHICPRFKHVLLISGNHELWGSNLKDHAVDFYNSTKHIPNLIFDNFEKIPFNYLGDSRPQNIWMGTLWTDYRNGNPVVMQECAEVMNDFKHIRNLEGGPLRPEDLLEVHNCMREQLVAGIQEGDVIMTHHAPTYLCVPPQYKTSPHNPAYASNMDHIIEEKAPVLWITGHNHTTQDFSLFDTRMVSNCYGYHGMQVNKKYNPNLVIEI